MRNILSLVVAGFVGGIVAFGLLKNEIKDLSQVHDINTAPRATLTSSSSAAFPFDFVAASANSTPGVVHISAGESQQAARKRYDDQRQQPGGDFFNFDDFFRGDFFGQGRRQQQGSGSGVIISSDGYIVTNNHVVGFADKILVTTDDGRKFEAEKIGTDPSSDLAVIKVTTDEILPTIPYGDSDDVQVGEWVLAVGNPFDYLTSTVTAGIVSAKGRDIDIIKGKKPIEEFIQTDAAVNPGNSGGALVDADGKLIGINTAIATPTGVYAGYSFAIPSNLVKRIVGEIIESGDIERANLGIFVRDVKELIDEGENIDADYGVVVDEVINGSSAQFAGLLPGDIITKVDRTTVKDFEDLKTGLKFVKVGDTVKVNVLRNGKRKSISVRLRKES